jgi:hypothetical protein
MASLEEILKKIKKEKEEKRISKLTQEKLINDRLLEEYNKKRDFIMNERRMYENISTVSPSSSASSAGGSKAVTNTVEEEVITYWYAQQTTSGTGDGTSVENASNIADIPWGSMGTRDTVYLMDTITDPIVVGASNIDIRGDLAGRLLIHDTNGFGGSLASGFKWVNAGVSNMYGGTYTRGAEECIKLDGAYDVETFNVITTDGVLNQNINLNGTGTSIWNDLTSTGAPDDGITGHEAANVTIQGQGTSITGNSEGVAMAGTGTTIIRNCTIEGNTLFDVTFNADIQNATIGKINNGGGVSNYSNVLVSENYSFTNFGGGSATLNAEDCIFETIQFKALSVGNYNQCLVLSQLTTANGINGTQTFRKTRFRNRIGITGNEVIDFKYCMFDSESSLHGIETSGTPTIRSHYNTFTSSFSSKYLIVLSTGVNYIGANNTYADETKTGRGFSTEVTVTERNSIFHNLDNSFYKAIAGPVVTAEDCCFSNAVTTGSVINTRPIELDPLLVDITGLDFTLGVSSPCIGAGVDLTENEGVDVANWGNGSTTTPVVTTKLQTNGAWDVGAYIS